MKIAGVKKFPPSGKGFHTPPVWFSSKYRHLKARPSSRFGVVSDSSNHFPLLVGYSNHLHKPRGISRVGLYFSIKPHAERRWKRFQNNWGDRTFSGNFPHLGTATAGFRKNEVCIYLH